MDESLVEVKYKCFLLFIVLALLEIKPFLFHIGKSRNLIRFAVFDDPDRCIDVLKDE